jgi:hypothetical protein
VVSIGWGSARIARTAVGPGGPHEAREGGKRGRPSGEKTDPYFFSSLNFLGV